MIAVNLARLRGLFYYFPYKFLMRKLCFPLHIWDQVFIENFKKISLGKNITFCSRCFISPLDLSVEDNTWIGYNCFLVGKVAIGKNVMIGPNVSIIGANHVIRRMDVPMIKAGLSVKGIKVGSDVWIGANAVLLDGVNISDGAVVAAGSVVTRNVASFSIVAGNPARCIGDRRETD